MVVRNVIIFGDPMIDRRFILELAGASLDPHSLPPRVFETQRYSVTIFEQEYALYYTAGLPGAGSSFLRAREVLGNLYRFIRALDGGINLLIYVVRTDKPSPIDFALFYDYLCQRDAPIILVQTAHSSSEPSSSWFRLVLTLDGIDPESDKVTFQKAIAQHLKENPKVMLPIERFELTARGSWKLLEKKSKWSLADCRDALKFTFEKYGFFSQKDAHAKCESIVESIKKRYFCNVIVFGDTGAGKTSVIKMLSDEVELDTTKAASAGGSTFESRAYEVDINEYHYVFHDTVGLEDGTSISLSPLEALKSLYQLILKVEGGVSLLVYVHRGKIKPSQVENYKLFTRVICKSKVPTVLVVTGLEEEHSRDDWWKANKDLYNDQEISTDFQACITSTKGRFNERYKEFVYQDQYEESKMVLKSLFLEAPLLNPWKIASSPNWWKLLVVEVYNIFAAKFKWKHLVANQTLYHDLMRIGMEEDQAKNWANNMDGVLPTRLMANHSIHRDSAGNGGNEEDRTKNRTKNNVHPNQLSKRSESPRTSSRPPVPSVRERLG